MIKLGTIFWIGLAAVFGFATFAVTYSVQGLDDDLLRVRKQTAVEQQEMRVLDAELTFLTQPARLEELNQRFLSLSAILPQQLSRSIGDIPFRPAPAPADTVVASREGGGSLPPGDLTSATLERSGPPPEARVAVAKPAAVKPAARPSSAAAVQSLDGLFAQVAGER